jgi:Ca2+-binding EF-hand superfamily protein
MTIRTFITASSAAIAFAALGTGSAQAQASQGAKDAAAKKHTENTKQNAEWEMHFKEADKNSDGAISKEELAQTKHFPYMHQHFGAMDANNDGKVTREEHHAWAKQHPELMKEAKAKK